MQNEDEKQFRSSQSEFRAQTNGRNSARTEKALVGAKFKIEDKEYQTANTRIGDL